MKLTPKILTPTDDKLPFDYPLGTALCIYARRYGIVALWGLLNLFLLMLNLLAICWILD